MEMKRSTNHSSQEKKQDDPPPIAHCLQHSTLCNSEIIQYRFTRSAAPVDICTNARQLKRPDHPIFNAEPADIHHQRVLQGNRHPNPQLPTKNRKIGGKRPLRNATTNTFFFISNCSKRCKRAWFWLPEYNISSNLEATARDWARKQFEFNWRRIHKRKDAREELWRTSRLNDWTSGNTVNISTRTIGQYLDQSRRSSAYFSQQTDDVTVTNTKKQIFAKLSENTNSRPSPKEKSNDVYRTSTTNERPEMMQQPCNTSEGQKAEFSHPATNDGPNRQFPMSVKAKDHRPPTPPNR